MGVRLRGGARRVVGTGGLMTMASVLPWMSSQVDLIAAMKRTACQVGADAESRRAAAVAVSPGLVALRGGPRRLNGWATPGWWSRSPLAVPTRSWPKGAPRWGTAGEAVSVR